MEKDKRKLILNKQYEIVDVENPTTFIFEQRHYRFDSLTKKEADYLIMSGFANLKKAEKKGNDSGSTDETKP